jgi:hypothetical protein
MASADYLEAVQRAAAELRAAQPWLLVMAHGESPLVARRRTAVMALVAWLFNLWRRPRRWWLGRLQLAYEARQAKGNRNG